MELKQDTHLPSFSSEDKLLIVPYGIETRIMKAANCYPHLSFNRTLWN